jgi:hypothetical protein
VTFKDLKKRVALEATEQQSMLFEKLRNKPFWIWNVRQHKHEDTSMGCYYYYAATAAATVKR